MSCQKGNTNRVRRQKHQNVMAFKNTLYDNSKRTKMIIDKEIAEVCKRCQDIIAWKVKYKKYKQLSQPKTCIKCQNKNIKDAYYIVCLTCAKNLDICCKCGKKEEIVAHFSPSESEQQQAMAQLEQEVKALSERKRRAYYRYIEKLKGKKKKKTMQTDTMLPCGSEGEDSEAADRDGAADSAVTVTPEEYLRSARNKLDELKKGMDENFFDDLEVLGINSSGGGDDDDDDDDDWEDEN